MLDLVRQGGVHAVLAENAVRTSGNPQAFQLRPISPAGGHAVDGHVGAAPRGPLIDQGTRWPASCANAAGPGWRAVSQAGGRRRAPRSVARRRALRRRLVVGGREGTPRGTPRWPRLARSTVQQRSLQKGRDGLSGPNSAQLPAARAGYGQRQGGMGRADLRRRASVRTARRRPHRSRPSASVRIMRIDTISRWPLISGTRPSAPSTRTQQLVGLVLRQALLVLATPRWPPCAGARRCRAAGPSARPGPRPAAPASTSSPAGRRGDARRELLPGVVGRQVELAGPAGDADAAADAHQPVVRRQRLAGLALHLVEAVARGRDGPAMTWSSAASEMCGLPR